MKWIKRIRLESYRRQWDVTDSRTFWQKIELHVDMLLWMTVVAYAFYATYKFIRK